MSRSQSARAKILVSFRPRPPSRHRRRLFFSRKLQLSRQRAQVSMPSTTWSRSYSNLLSKAGLSFLHLEVSKVKVPARVLCRNLRTIGSKSFLSNPMPFDIPRSFQSHKYRELRSRAYKNVHAIDRFQLWNHDHPCNTPTHHSIEVSRHRVSLT